MAQYANLKADIVAAIYNNSNQEITGAVLQGILTQIVDTVGADYLYVGVATPTTNPGTIDQMVFYIASQAGTYTNFGGIVVAEDDGVVILKYNSSWTKETTGIASAAQLNQLGQECFSLFPNVGADGFFNPLGGYYITTGYTLGANAQMVCTRMVRVMPGEKYTFTGYFTSNLFPAVAGFSDLDRNNPVTLVQSGDNKNVELTIPAGVYYIQAWGYGNHSHILEKIGEVETLKGEVETLKDTNYFIGGEDNKYIVAGGGGLGANASWRVSKMFSVNPGDFILYQGKNNAGGLGAVWGYSDSNRSNPVALINGLFNGAQTFMVPDGVYFIQAQSTKDVESHIQFVDEIYLNYDSTMGTFRNFIETNIVNSSPTHRYIILVSPGTYDLSSEFTQEEISGNTIVGIVIPNYTTVIGVAGAEKTIFTLNVSSGRMSTFNLVGTCSLIGLTIEGHNCRYAIHDDFSVNNDGTHRIIKNCRIIADNCTYGFAYGGGCRSGQVFEFENTYFYGNGGFLMHSNVSYTRPTFLKLKNCKCESITTHPEKAIEIRGLAGVANPVMNYAEIENCQADGLLLVGTTTGEFDWEINLSNSVLKTNTALQNTDYTPVYRNGMMRFVDGAPRWWDGSSYVDANGN